MMNSVNIIGNLGAAPEVRAFPSGKKVARLSVAINTYSKQQDAPPIWVKCELWDQAVERLQKCNLKAGTRIAVSGSLAMNQFQKTVGTQSFTERQLYVKVQSFTILSAKDEQPEPVAAPETPEATDESDETNKEVKARRRPVIG